MEQRGEAMLINPNLLRGFYDSDRRYLPEFEQPRHIFEELGLVNNPIRIAHAMIGLENRFVAGKHDPDQRRLFQTR